MSRTIRRMPFRSSRGKQYAKAEPRTRPAYDRIRIIRLENGTSLSAAQVERLIRHYAFKRHIFQPSWRGRYTVSHDIIYQECRAEYDEMFKADILLWCLKNGTCKRQRKNAVRYTKRLMRRQDRFKAKQDLRFDLASWYLEDIEVQ